MKPEVFEVDSIDDLTVDIHVIGYIPQGESTILFIKNKGEILYSIVTDCYSSSIFAKVEDILSKNGVDDINVFIWTHPHFDHSKGIEEFLKAKDKSKKAHVFLPKCVDSKMDGYMVAKKTKEIVTFLHDNYNTGARSRYHTIDVDLDCDTNTEYSMISIHDKNTHSSYLGTIHFLLPNSKIIDYEKAKLDPQIHPRIDINVFSIVHFFSINRGCYLLCGDYKNCDEKNWIEQLPIDNIRFIKIPHHGSNKANEVINTLKYMIEKRGCQDEEEGNENEGKKVLFDRENKSISDASVTTVFTSKNLPDNGILSDYSDISKKVYCTGNQKSLKYGYVNLVYSVSNGGELIKANLEGSAYEYKK